MSNRWFTIQPGQFSSLLDALGRNCLNCSIPRIDWNIYLRRLEWKSSKSGRIKRTKDVERTVIGVYFCNSTNNNNIIVILHNIIKYSNNTIYIYIFNNRSHEPKQTQKLSLIKKTRLSKIVWKQSFMKNYSTIIK